MGRMNACLLYQRLHSSCRSDSLLALELDVPFFVSWYYLPQVTLLLQALVSVSGQEV